MYPSIRSLLEGFRRRDAVLVLFTEQFLPAYTMKEFAETPEREFEARYGRLLDAINQNGMVGRVKGVMAMNISSQTKHAENTALEVGRMIVRLHLSTTYTEEVLHFKPHLDDALTSMYAGLQRSGMPIDDFWCNYKSVTSLVMNAPDVHAVLSCVGSWSDVARQINSLCSDSQLGLKMFGFCQAYAASSAMASCILDLLEEVSKNVKFTNNHRAGMVRDATHEADIAHIDHLFAGNNTGNFN